MHAGHERMGPWPLQQHEIVPPINRQHVGFRRDHHTFSWIFVRLMAWAHGHRSWYPDFPGDDARTIFPAIIAHLSASMRAAGETDAIFDAAHYVQCSAQERVMSWRGNVGGQAASMYGLAVATLAGEQLRDGGCEVQNRAQWVLAEHSFSTDPIIFQLLNNNAEMLLPNAYLSRNQGAFLNAAPVDMLPRRVADSYAQLQTPGDHQASLSSIRVDALCLVRPNIFCFKNAVGM